MIITVLLPTQIEVDGKLCGRECPGRAGHSYLCRYFPTKRAPDRVLRKTKDHRYVRCAQCRALEQIIRQAAGKVGIAVGPAWKHRDET